MRTKIIILPECCLSSAEISRQLDGSVTMLGIRKSCLRYQETNSIKTKLGNTNKGAPHLLMTKNKKLCLHDRKISSPAIRSVLNDAGVSVGLRIIRSTLSFVRLKDRIP